MSGDVSNKKRLVLVTEGCIRQNLLYLSGHHDFFPKQCYGASSKKKGEGHPVTLVVEGLRDHVQSPFRCPGFSRRGFHSNVRPLK